MGVKTPPNVNRKLIEIQQMGLPALREKFKELYGYPTNIMHAQTLRKKLSYRIQELFYGGLTDVAQQELNVIADTDPAENIKVTTKQETVLLPGSRVSRVWRGKNYEVTVRSDGRFTYDGRVFRSLSGIATEITGSHWNGKTFFGVK